MAAPRPPQGDPPAETIDIDETAPPQRSPLRGVLPFGTASAKPAFPPPAPPAAPPAIKPARFGEDTAPAERSPLAAALPFRHAKPSASTVAIPVPTPDDLRRLGAGGPAPAQGATARGGQSAAERARLEMAKTVAFAMPPGTGEAAPASVAAAGTQAARPGDHFGLSIEQYAALCAEVAVFPERAEAIFAQYGLAARKDRLTADAAWQDRLRADAALMQRWQTLYLYYHEQYHRSAKR